MSPVCRLKRDTFPQTPIPRNFLYSPLDHGFAVIQRPIKVLGKESARGRPFLKRKQLLRITLEQIVFLHFIVQAFAADA